MKTFIDRETYEKLPVENKLDILYDITIQTHERLENLEYKKVWNTCIAAISGVMGGFLAMLGRAIWKQ